VKILINKKIKAYFTSVCNVSENTFK
jgi:hypothetical protein